MTPMEIRLEIYRLVSAVELVRDPAAKIKMVQDRIRAFADTGQSVPQEFGWLENRLRLEFAEAA